MSQTQTYNNDVFRQAAQNVENKNKANYKLLPGTKDGTVYKGFVSRVEINIVTAENSENKGREMLVIRTQVTEGEFKGWSEVFNRVIHPASLDEPTADEWNNRITARVAELKAKNSTQVIDEKAVKHQLVQEWRTKILNYAEKTIEDLRFIGVDTSSMDESTILALAANTVHNPVAWKVKDLGAGKRLKFLEDPARFFDRATNDEAPNLFEELPTGDDIPIN